MKSISSPCYLRFFHAFPTFIALDIYMNDSLVGKDLLYEDFTPYKGYEAQSYTLTICRHREKEPYLTQEIQLCPQKSYTLILYAAVPDQLAIFLFNEPYKKLPDDHFLAHTINLSLYPGPLKLHFIDQRPEFKKLLPAHYTSYLAFPPDTYDLQLYNPELQESFYEVSQKPFKSLRYYAFYIIGGYKDYPLKVLTTIEGNSLYHFS